MHQTTECICNSIWKKGKNRKYGFGQWCWSTKNTYKLDAWIGYPRSLLCNGLQSIDAKSWKYTQQSHLLAISNDTAATARSVREVHGWKRLRVGATLLLGNVGNLATTIVVNFKSRLCDHCTVLKEHISLVLFNLVGLDDKNNVFFMQVCGINFSSTLAPSHHTAGGTALNWSVTLK